MLRLMVWLGLLAVVFVPLEALFAVQPRKFLSRHLLSDTGFYFINSIVPALILTPPLTLVAMAAYSVVPWQVQMAAAGLPVWLRAALALVVSEAGFYWGHRWAHEVPFLWRFHAIHHRPDEVYFLVSSRAHPLDSVFIRLCGLVPVYALGIATPLTRSGGTVAAVLVLVLTMWGFFIHANLRWKLGPLEWLVSTPKFHHWHHTLAEPRDRNYASMLPWMDRIFGTHYLPRAWPESYGIDGKLPETLGGQLIYPFTTAPDPTPARLPAAE